MLMVASVIISWLSILSLTLIIRLIRMVASSTRNLPGSSINCGWLLGIWLSGKVTDLINVEISGSG